MIDHEEGCQVVSAEGICTCGAHAARCARKHDPKPFVTFTLLMAQGTTFGRESRFAPREQYCQDRNHYSGRRTP